MNNEYCYRCNTQYDSDFQSCNCDTAKPSLNEAPQLTPVHKTPAHVDNTDYGYRGDVEEHYSRVFHRNNPGRIVATFVGENHRADSQAYCDWCQTRDGQPG